MKKLVLSFTLFTIVLTGTLFAAVDSRLKLIDNSNGRMVLDIEAISTDEPVAIATYQGTFKVCDSLKERMLGVYFTQHLFDADNYHQDYGWSREYHKVGFMYDFYEGMESSMIGTEWTRILRIYMDYLPGDVQGCWIMWVNSSPQYQVTTTDGSNVTGDYYDPPDELQSFSLPVVLSEFSATYDSDKGIVLNWQTESEMNNLGFHIHRSSKDNPMYEQVTENLIQGHGTTNDLHYYTYTDTDELEPGTYYYVVENLATDGETDLSRPVAVTVQSTTTVESEQPTTPKQFDLLQNYPNPFNPSTTVQYDLAEQKHVTIRVYSRSGQLVRTLVNAQQSAGSHSVIWNGLNDAGESVASGIYYCQMKVDGFSQTRKMTLLK